MLLNSIIREEPYHV